MVRLLIFTAEGFQGILHQVGDDVQLRLGNIKPEAGGSIREVPGGEGSTSGECYWGLGGGAELKGERGQDQVDEGSLHIESTGDKHDPESQEVQEGLGQQLGKDDRGEYCDEQRDALTDLAENIDTTIITTSCLITPLVVIVSDLGIVS